MKKKSYAAFQHFAALTCILLCAGWFSDVYAAERDIVQSITQGNRSISQADRDVKFCKMAESPFIFYRGTNHLFWQDFANDSRLAQFGTPQTQTWIQGDLHAYNFGAYHTHEGTIVYGLNDFDEAVIADYQYDVWRMAISLVLIARENGSFKPKDQEDIVDAFTEGYLDTLEDVHGKTRELTTLFTSKTTKGELDDFLKDVEKKENRLKMLKKWTTSAGGKLAFNPSLEELEEVPQDIRQDILKAMPAYGGTLTGALPYHDGYFRVKSLARRLLAGTGSLGAQRYYLLIEGNSDSDDDDLILDVKQQSRPTPYQYLGHEFQQFYDTHFANDAQRVILASRLLGSVPNGHAGWMTLADGVYAVQERSPYKESFPTEKLQSEKRFEKLAEQWGEILAIAHARADNDAPDSLISSSFEEQVTQQTDGHHDEFRALVRQIAFAYADQVQTDWRTFLKTIRIDCPQ